MSRQKNQSSGEDKLSASEQQLKATIQQLRASEQQLKAANQQLNASNQQLQANQEELRKVNHDLQERVKELTCLYGLSHLAERRDVTSEEVFQGIAELIPSAWQYPEITAARVIFDNRQFKTSNFRETTWMQSADIKVHGRKVGTIEVCYLRKRPAIDEGPFLREERNLLNALAEHLGSIAERKKAEEALRKSEREYRRLVDTAQEGIWIIDEEAKTSYVNQRMAEMLGYSPEEMLNRSLFDFMDEKATVEAKRSFEQRQRGIREQHDFRFQRKDGSNLWAIVTTNPILDNNGQFIGALGMITDITERKQAEDALRAMNQQLRASEQQFKAANQQLRANGQQLKAANQQLQASEQQLKATNQQLQASEQQLKSLASQLTLAEESERHRIAMELHATIGQSLVVSKLQLDELRASAPSADIARTLGEVCNSLDQSIQETKSLTFDLSSPILYELGFETAVAEWLTERIEEKHRIATEFEDDGQPKPLDEDVRVFLFRDVRELLFNVVRHAKAKKVKVSIRKVGRQIQVGIEDDGIGFDPEKTAATAVRKGGFGLFSIRERLEQLGGQLEIESAPGRGCKATVTAPLRGE